MSEKTRAARRLLHHQGVGVLSTHSVDVEGYPFGSIAPFALGYDGEPVILISDIAQHTRNIERDKRVSLTVFDRLADDPQAGGRLTWIGDAEPLEPSDTGASRRYLRFFPSAESYFETHGFSFYRVRLRRARFIGGFGQIYWIERDAMLVENPFRETEEGILEHMNRDHQKALFHYCKAFEGT
jgi:putative heme iron utilization protein